MDDPQIGIGIALSMLTGALYGSAAGGLEALGEAHLYAIAEAPDKRGSMAKAVLVRLPALRIRLLVGRTASVGVAAFLAAQLSSLLSVGVSGHALNLVVVLLVYGFVVVLASSIVRRRAATAALPLLRVMRPFELLVAPIAAPFVVLHSALERVVEEATEQDPERLTALAVEHMIDEGEEQGSIDEGQAEMLRSVLDFRETVAREVMVPRPRMVAFSLETPIDAVLRATVESGHSRYPVYVDSLDMMEGVLYVKDLLQVLQLGVQPDELSLRDLIRRPTFVVQESARIGEVLREMQARRWHLAVVKDEFGATSGVVTLEDILEEIVGEIHDEYDGDDEPRLERVSETRFDIDAAMPVHDVEEATGLALRGEASSDTIGGLVVELAGHVPVPGTLVESPQARFTVLEADERRVRRVRLDLTEEQQAAS